MRIKSFFATTVSITLLLLLGGVAAYLMLGAQEKANILRSEFTASIYIQDTVSKLDLLQVENNLQRNQSVRSVLFVTKEQAAKDFTKQMGIDFQGLFDTNPLPASFQVKLKKETDVREFQKTAQMWKGVEEVTYPYELAQEVNTSLDQLGYFVIGFSLVLSFVLIVVMRNTVRMDVAASENIIRRAVSSRMAINLVKNPFLLRAYSQGALAGAIASVFLFIATDGIALTFPLAKLPIDIKLMGVIFAVMTLAGIMLTTLFTYFAVNIEIRNARKTKNY